MINFGFLRGTNDVQIQRERDEKTKQKLSKEFEDKSAMSANAERDIGVCNTYATK